MSGTNLKMQDKMNAAFLLYGKGLSTRELAKLFKVSQKTVQRYKNKDKWDDMIEESHKEAREKLPHTVAEMNVIDYNRIEGLIQKILKQINIEKATATDVVNLTKLKRLITGEVTDRSESREEQLVLQIISSKDEDTLYNEENNKMATIKKTRRSVGDSEG